ncbi:MAG: T9SS type A sorting domain-containing protein, partial [Bacteroidaceae bacterium]|nr:T9SS type A sorting domain-containing protein [Bacteroidaceae bacterium]
MNNRYKMMNKYILALLLSLQCIALLGQVETFETFILEEGNKPTAMIELNDGYLIAANNNAQNVSKWLRLTHSGTLDMNKEIYPGRISGVANILHDPCNEHLYYALGALPPNGIFIHHFDENIDLIDSREITIPIEDGTFSLTKAIMNREGGFIVAGAKKTPSGAIISHLFIKLTFGGVIEEMGEDASSHTGIIGDICEHPSLDDYYWVYKIGNDGMSIFGLNSEMESEILSNVSQIRLEEDEGVTIIEPFSFGNSTIIPLSDSTMLVADRCHVSFLPSCYPYTPIIRYPGILYVVTLDGTILHYLTIPSSTQELHCYPAFFKATDAQIIDAIAGKFHYSCYSDIDVNNELTANKLSIIKTDDETNTEWQRDFFIGEPESTAMLTMATTDGGCIICGTVGKFLTSEYKKVFVIKTDAMGLCGTHESSSAFSSAYPNPGNATLNIRTALKDATVEVYDLQGRMVARQAVD